MGASVWYACVYLCLCLVRGVCVCVCAHAFVPLRGLSILGQTSERM